MSPCTWRHGLNSSAILVIADPHIPVPPVYYGGAERVIARLCEGLAQMGYVVDLMAGPGSKSYGGQLHVHRLHLRRSLSAMLIENYDSKSNR